MKKNLANYISAIRIILSPIIVCLFLLGNFKIATILYLFGLLTDVIDGFIARRLRTVSNFGTIWDPITSVIMFYSVSLTLVLLGYISWVYPFAIGIFSFSSLIFGRITKNMKLRRNLHVLDIVIGSGIGDLGIGLLMTYIFIPELSMIIYLFIVIMILIKYYYKYKSLVLR